MTREPRPTFGSAMPSKVCSLAALTATLMLGACAQTADLLPKSNALADNETAATTEPASQGPQSELEKATAYWGQEFSKNPTQLKSALNYARNLKAMGEKQKAIAVLQQASALHDGDPELASEYGRLALELDQVNAAAKLLAVADNPSKPDWRVVSARGTVAAKQGQYKDAIALYERALTLSSDQPTVLNNLAMAYAMTGDAQKAEEILHKAANSNGATPKIRQNLALVMGLQGRYDEARKVASADTGSETAAANADYLRRMVKLEPKSAPAVADTAPVFKTDVTRTAQARPASRDSATAMTFKPAALDIAPVAAVTDVWKADVAATSDDASKGQAAQ